MALYNLLKKFNKNKLFVETGIFHGDGIRSAIASNMFDEIHSIDINENYVEIAKNNFSNISLSVFVTFVFYAYPL